MGVLSDRENPLEGLLARSMLRPESGEPNRRIQQVLLEWLDGLEEVLRTPLDEKIQWYGFGWCANTEVLPPADVARAQNLFRQVVTRTGYGKAEIVGSLLLVLAMNSDSGLVPFWTELLDLQINRDSLSRKRKRFALSVLAFMVIDSGAEEALKALVEATRHSNADIRTDATYFLGQVCLEADELVAREVSEAFEERARSDRSFGPRFLARLILREYGQPVPFDNPNNVVAFKVSHIYHRDVHRVIEAVPANTLHDLQTAIQDAFEWDTDHLYSFFLTSRPFDYRFTFENPRSDSENRTADLVAVGDLGLRRGQKFTYLFDYNHTFEIVVKGVKGQREKGEYPRLVESVGEAMKQHEIW